MINMLNTVIVLSNVSFRIATPVMTKTTLRDDDDSSVTEEQPSELDEEE